MTFRWLFLVAVVTLSCAAPQQRLVSTPTCTDDSLIAQARSARSSCIEQGLGEEWCDCYARTQAQCSPMEGASTYCDGQVPRKPAQSTELTPSPPAEPPREFTTSELRHLDAPLGGYKRSEWRHWIDEDGDCQDTRTEVLIAESEIPVAFKDADHCKVASGKWTCPYTGKVYSDPSKLDIDHLVALGNAARSGGQAWDNDRKRAYANDLSDPDQLIAVDASANRSKSDRGPDEWLPPRTEYRCTYARNWIRLKDRWALGVTAAERIALATVVATCTRSPDSITGLANSNRLVEEAPASATKGPTWAAPRRTSAPVCKVGCPCGNSCIQCSKTCHK